MGNKRFSLWLGTGLITAILAFLLLTILFYPLNLQIRSDNRLKNSSVRHILGTDELGRDFFSCLVLGIGISFSIAVVVVSLSALLGLFLGLAAGLGGRMVDTVIMRVVDVILAFPGLLLAIAVLSFLGPGAVQLILILVFSGWVGFARIVRGQVLALKQREFILAARSYNASFFRLLLHHLLPLVLPMVITQVGLDIASVILTESSLNFLGIGISPQIPTLGQMIDAGRGHIFIKPELMIIPSLSLFLIIFGFNLLGEGLKGRLLR